MKGSSSSNSYLYLGVREGLQSSARSPHLKGEKGAAVCQVALELEQNGKNNRGGSQKNTALKYVLGKVGVSLKEGRHKAERAGRR